MKITALLDALNSALAEPFALAWVSNSPRFLLVFTVIYAVAVIVAVTDQKNTRPGAEHGSAAWGDVFRLNKFYMDRHGSNLLLTQHFHIGMVSTIITQSGSSGMSSVTLPQELIDAINNVGFWDSIPLWAVTLIGGLLITVLSFTMILTVYGRMFSLWMYAAIAPIPLSTFAGEPTGSVGKNFIRSYAGVCLQGVVIALSCIIFSAISSSPPAVDTGASVVTAVWTYVGELAFNLLVLVGAIKGCDRIVKEIMGL